MTAPARVATLAGALPPDALGIPSFCTAHPGVLRAVLAHAARHDLPVLIEATCNQVNQEGGYTGQTPAEFAAGLRRMAAEAGVGNRLILGGDHLGPNPWRREPARAAMAKGEALVAAFVAAGATKIHLDASMALGGEPQPDPATVAARAARLAAAAETAASDAGLDPLRLGYVIGTEVPIPGGEADGHVPSVTTPEALRETLDTHRAAFEALGSGAALRPSWSSPASSSVPQRSRCSTCRRRGTSWRRCRPTPAPCSRRTPPITSPTRVWPRSCGTASPCSRLGRS